MTRSMAIRARFLLSAIMALCMAVFPLSAVNAAAFSQEGQAVHSHARATATAEVDHHAAHLDSAVQDQASVGEHQHASSDGGHADAGSACCGSLGCHAFQVSGPPALPMAVSAVEQAFVGSDQQVATSLSVRLDRPPKSA